MDDNVFESIYIQIHLQLTVFISPNEVDTINIIPLLYKRKSSQDQRMKANINYD